jgi:CHAT domain-containing protein
MMCVFFAVVYLLAFPAQPAQADPDLKSLLDTAAAYRREGNLYRALEILEGAHRAAGPNCEPRLAGDLGVTYYQAHRFQEAEAQLKDAYARSTDVVERARFANDLGNLKASRGLTEEAARLFEEARSAAGVELPVALGAGLNLARLAPADKRLDRLALLLEGVATLPDPHQRARYFLNLGNQARSLGTPALKLAYESLHQARRLAREAGDRVLLAETLDELSQLYEDQSRAADAMKLTDEAVVTLPAEQGKDLLIGLHWRRARLLRKQGDDDQALRAYQSAVEQIESIRQDIPVEYIDGRSSFRETLEPIYLGLADLLLRKAANGAEIDRRQLFRRARDTVELIKQTELQDYLGERCSVESARPLTDTAFPAGTAVFYPVMLDDRLELLIETRRGIESRQVPIGAAALREKIQGFAKSLREARLDYLPRGKDLYALLLKPLEDVLAQNEIDTLIVIPDGALRLIPFGALHDGKQFAMERFGIAIAPGLTISGGGAGAKKEQGRILLAGVAEPGPAVDKLPQSTVEELSSEEPHTETRSAELRKKLALPAVKQEIQALKGKTRSDSLLDGEFTVERFRRQVNTGSYRVVHIASHAIFSRHAATSFIMAYDDILTMDDLQRLLRAEQLQESPIEMLTLSACQTAEGDDRAPLGIAGAVLKARASSALGSLWPVADEATKALMVRFYELFAEGLSKGKALQRAQMELSRNPEFQHPYYWAPFILVGGWQ